MESVYGTAGHIYQEANLIGNRPGGLEAARHYYGTRLDARRSLAPTLPVPDIALISVPFVETRSTRPLFELADPEAHLAETQASAL